MHKQLLRFRIRDLVEYWRSRNTISVRSSAVRRDYLWFHLTGFVFAKPGTSFTLAVEPYGAGYEVDFESLSPLAQPIVSRIIALKGVISMDIREDYFAVEVLSENDWRRLLPQIVDTIQRWHPRGYVRVRVRPHFDPREEGWLEPLLARIFPLVHLTPVNPQFKKHVLKIVARAPAGQFVTSHEILYALPWYDVVFNSADLPRALWQLVATRAVEVKQIKGESLYSITSQSDEPSSQS